MYTDKQIEKNSLKYVNIWISYLFLSRLANRKYLIFGEFGWIPRFVFSQSNSIKKKFESNLLLIVKVIIRANVLTLRYSLF